MAIMKAPRVERRHLQTLRDLLKITYTRAVDKFFSMPADKQPATAKERADIILGLTDKLQDAEMPLAMAQTLMDLHKAQQAWLPLVQERFDFYLKTINIVPVAADVAAAPADEAARTLERLNKDAAELKQLFAEAREVDSNDKEALLREDGMSSKRLGPVRAQTQKPKTFLN